MHSTARDKPALLGGLPAHSTGWPAWPIWDQQEEQALLGVLHSGNWWSYTLGQATEESIFSPSWVTRFQRAFANAHDCHYGICTANGTLSLEIALRAAGVHPGDEVIVPAYTFIATVTAVLMIGAIPIFVDIDSETYNINPRRLEEALSEFSRAIIPVHFGGQPCEMDLILEFADKHSLKVIEDAAHAHGSSYNHRMCGSLGDLGSFSFQASKNMTAGEGGIIITNDLEAAEICEGLVWVGRRKGHAWYEHFDLATNARLTEFQAAILQAQLNRLPKLTQRRMANARILDALLTEIEGIRPMRILPSTTSHAYHLYMFRYDPVAFSGLSKQRFVEVMQSEGIQGASCGYGHPLYSNPLFIEKTFLGEGFPVNAFAHGKRIHYPGFIERCPVSERACREEAIWLTQNMLLADEDSIQDIAVAVRKIQNHAQKLRYNPTHETSSAKLA
jgi:dTDP-4-amino-4,6-dideoxygalactose transaminase